MRKKRYWVLLFVLCFSFPVIYKAVPFVRDKECFRSFFPKESFLAKLAKPPPAWMEEQLAADLQPFNEITPNALDRTYSRLEKIFDRYRIIDNQLYKYVPQGKRLSSRDNVFERALKTLLLYARVPNIEKVEWARSHDPEVQQIVQNARDFAKNNLLCEDDYLYLYLALKEYGSRQRIDWKMTDSWVCIHYRKRLDLLKSWRRFFTLPIFSRKSES